MSIAVLGILLAMTFALIACAAETGATPRGSASSSGFDRIWDYNDPAGTEAKFRELLPEMAKSQDRGLHAQLLTQIARAQGLQRRFEDAHRTLDEAERLVIGEMKTARIRLLLERGRVFNSSREPERARPLFAEAWTHARRAGLDFHAIDAAHMLAIVSAGRETLAWNERAIALAEESRDERAGNWIGALHNNVGWRHHANGDFATALQSFERALEHRLRQGDAGQIRVARWCIARALRSLGRIAEALAMQESLLRETESGGAASDGFVHEEIGECLLALGRADEPRPHFARAHAILSQDAWLVEREPQRIQRLRALSTK